MFRRLFKGRVFFIVERFAACKSASINKRPHEIREVFYHDISMRINEDFSFYRLYHGIYATICSRRTPAKACLLKLYFLLQFSKALSNRQYRRFSFRVNQDIFCHSTTPCPQHRSCRCHGSDTMNKFRHNRP